MDPNQHDQSAQPPNTGMLESLKQQGFMQKMIVSNLILERAFAFYTEGLYELAAAAYTLSLSILSTQVTLNPQEDSLYQEHKYIVLCNLVICFIQQKIFVRARGLVEGLVRMFPERAKPYKLRALVETSSLNDSLDRELACQDLSKAIMLDPAESAINFDVLTKAKPKRYSFKSSRTKEIQQRSWRLIKKVFQREKSEFRAVAPKRFHEDQDERPLSSDGRFKTRFIEKTKKLWTKINKSIDSETEYAYEEDERIAVPPEISKIEEYLDKKGQQILELLQKTKRLKEAQKFQVMLQKARRLKQKLEKISKLDLSKPKKKLLQLASQLGLDLFNPIVQQELKRMHREKMEKLKLWIDKVFGGDIAQKTSQDDQCLYPVGSQPEIIVNQPLVEPVGTLIAQEAIVPIEQRKGDILTQEFISTQGYTGKAKVYSYDRSYGIAGLIGIVASIAILAAIQRCYG